MITSVDGLQRAPGPVQVLLGVFEFHVRHHVALLLGAVRTEGALDAGLLAALVPHVEVEPPTVAVRLAAAGAGVVGLAPLPAAPSSAPLAAPGRRAEPTPRAATLARHPACRGRKHHLLVQTTHALIEKSTRRNKTNKTHGRITFIPGRGGLLARSP